MNKVQPHSELFQLIFQQEKFLLLPHSRGDVPVLDTILHDDFEEVSASGKKANKAMAMEWLIRDSDDSEWTLTDFTLRQISTDVVLANYIATIILNEKGQEKRYASSSIWRKSVGEWAMIYHQGTRLDKS